MVEFHSNDLKRRWLNRSVRKVATLFWQSVLGIVLSFGVIASVHATSPHEEEVLLERVSTYGHSPLWMGMTLYVKAGQGADTFNYRNIQFTADDKAHQIMLQHILTSMALNKPVKLEGFKYCPPGRLNCVFFRVQGIGF